MTTADPLGDDNKKSNAGVLRFAQNDKPNEALIR
jgi:hypothetical protein